MEFQKKIEEIRRIMKRVGINAYFVTVSDEHSSEYIPANYKIINYIIGFDGSFGELLITRDKVIFWTDSRYDAQIREKLSKESIQIITLGLTDSKDAKTWISDNMEEGSVVGFNGKTISALKGEGFENSLTSKKIKVKRNLDIVDEFWKTRPKNKIVPAYILEERYSGKSCGEKLSEIRKKMKEENCNCLVTQSLAEIAWLLNIRGGDIKNNPFIISNCIVGERDVSFYVELEKISPEIKNIFKEENIIVREYSEFYSDVIKLEKDSRILIDKEKINYGLLKSIDRFSFVDKSSVISEAMSIKNSVEIENLKKAHIKDGVAVSKFIYWINNRIGEEKITESEAAKKIDELRKEQENFIEPSFDTISAYMENAAMPHYSYKDNKEVLIKNKGLYLVDSGGQYLEGTTDVTRTIVLGEVSDEIKRDYTLVLKGLIKLSNAKFLHGATGAHLDYCARGDMWQYGINYNHGTGHGIGYLSGVHEGPYGISMKNLKNPLIPGILLSNEPGIYRLGSHGIRLENNIVVKDYIENEYGKFYQFETLTLVPLDVKGIKKEMLKEEEIEWINNYNRNVLKNISPFLSQEEKKWIVEEFKNI